VINDLISNLLAANVRVVDRQHLDKIHSEQEYQESGYVSDDTAVTLGNELGATVIIVGSGERQKDYYWMNFKLLSVRTARILSQTSVNVRYDGSLVLQQTSAYNWNAVLGELLSLKNELALRGYTVLLNSAGDSVSRDLAGEFSRELVSRGVQVILGAQAVTQSEIDRQLASGVVDDSEIKSAGRKSGADIVVQLVLTRSFKKQNQVNVLMTAVNVESNMLVCSAAVPTTAIPKADIDSAKLPLENVDPAVKTRESAMQIVKQNMSAIYDKKTGLSAKSVDFGGGAAFGAGTFAYIQVTYQTMMNVSASVSALSDFSRLAAAVQAGYVITLSQVRVTPGGGFQYSPSEGLTGVFASGTVTYSLSSFGFWKNCALFADVRLYIADPLRFNIFLGLDYRRSFE